MAFICRRQRSSSADIDPHSLTVGGPQAERDITKEFKSRSEPSSKRKSPGRIDARAASMRPYSREKHANETLIAAVRPIVRCLSTGKLRTFEGKDIKGSKRSKVSTSSVMVRMV